MASWTMSPSCWFLVYGMGACLLAPSFRLYLLTVPLLVHVAPKTIEAAQLCAGPLTRYELRR